MQKVKNYTVLMMFLTIAATAFGQENKNQKIDYKTGDPATWPAELDAVIAAQKNHKILLENDQVRVLLKDPYLRKKEPLHHHKWPSVLYFQEAGDFMDYDKDGKVIFDSRELPEPLNFPLTMQKGPEAPHSVVNLSKTTPIRLIWMEMKPDHIKNIAVIDNLYKAFAIGEIPKVLELMDAEIVWNEAEGNTLADGNPYIGPEAVLNGVFARIAANHEYFKLEDIQLHQMNDHKILATLRYDAKSKANW